jgi:transcriptional regulator with XRE-family HTH domain
MPPLDVADKKQIAIQVGKTVKCLRTDKNMSMQQLATIAEIEKTQVFRIEHGMFDIKLSTLYVIAEALNVDVRDLLSAE